MPYSRSAAFILLADRERMAFPRQIVPNPMNQESTMQTKPGRRFFSMIHWRWIIALCFLALIPGCSPGLSSQARSGVTYRGAFTYIQQDPSAHVGETVLLGGRILDIRTSEERSEIMVLQMPLDHWNSPIDEDRSEGRFLVFMERFLDPVIYNKGKLMSLVGVVRGSEIRAIDQYEYSFPTIDAIEIKLWLQDDAYLPNIRLGIGVGTYF